MPGTAKKLRDPAIEIIEEVMIPATCRERFLPLHDPLCAPLRRLGVHLAGLSDLRPGYRIGRPRPSFHMALFALEGSGRLILPEMEQRLEPGSLMLAPVDFPYAFRPDGASWRMLWFHFDREAATGFESCPHIRHAHELERLANSVEALLGEWLGAGGEASRAAALHAQLIELYLKRELEGERESDPLGHRRRLQQLWESVDTDLQRAWRVSDLARRAHLSPTHLHRLTLGLHGITPMKMVERLRMIRARDLLQQHEYPVQWIAGQVGYENPYAFSTAFRRFWGESPRTLRRRLQARP